MSDMPVTDPVSPADSPAQSAGSQQDAPGGVIRLMVPVSELTAHPGNVREDLELTTEFCASIAHAGVRVALLVTPGQDGGYRVVEGHRRLAAAIKAGLAEVPCDVDPGRAGDEAGQYLDMLLANGGAYRRNFAPVEEAAALFAAHEAGASRTELRKATGRKADEIKAGLKAARISPSTRAAAGDLTRQLSLEDLALLAEFDGDGGAVSRIIDALQRGYHVEYEAERIRQERAEMAEHERLVSELTAAGVQVTDGLPDGAVRLSQLLHDGEDLTAEAHADCPGRGAFFPPWDMCHVVHYCLNPGEHGPTPHSSLLARPAAAGPGTAAGADAPDAPAPGAAPAPAEAPPDPARRLVIAGNKAWQAAAEVRKRWLTDVLFARRSAPRETAPFIARQLLAMPEPLRTGLSLAPGRVGFSDIARQDAAKWLEICDTTAAGRLPLLMLAPIAVTYELAMTHNEGRNTWRTDNRWSPCPRTQAGQYLAFLASAGHELSPIEQAVVDGVPWTGDTSDEDALPAADGTDSADAPATAGEADAAGQAEENDQPGARPADIPGVTDQAA
jgi:ParB family transcriptional regulator, chromosome partitioning protein